MPLSSSSVTPKIGGKAYLFRFYGGRGTYLVAMVPLAALADARYMQIDTDAVMLFSDKNNEPLTSVDFVEENGINLNGDYENYFISGEKQRYMIVGRDLAGTDCRAILAVNESGYFGSLDGLQAALLVLSLLALVLIPVIQWRLTNSISKPVEGLRSVMEHIRAGNLEAKAEGKTNIREFNEVNETFNTMMTQIKDLKIESYEHEDDAVNGEIGVDVVADLFADGAAVHINGLHAARVERLADGAANALHQEQNAGDLETAARAACAGADEHERKQDCFGKRRPLLERRAFVRGACGREEQRFRMVRRL